MPFLASSDIEKAKAKTAYSHPDPVHEHGDCIRIAYEWLDAQVTIKGVGRKRASLKHVIEQWGGRRISRSDVEVAAHMHPRIRGHYPRFNLSAKLTRPSDKRLEGIAQARTQVFQPQESAGIYAREES